MQPQCERRPNRSISVAENWGSPQYCPLHVHLRTFGLIGDVESIGPMPRKLESLLAPDGRVLVQDVEIGRVLECQWRFRYRNLVGDPFRWLNLGLANLRSLARAHGWPVERVPFG